MSTIVKKLRNNEDVYQELRKMDWLGSNGIRYVTNPGGTVSLRIGNAGDAEKFIRESAMRSGMGWLPESEEENMLNWVENNDTCTDAFVLCDSYDTPQVIYNRTTGEKYVTGVKYSTTTSGHRNAFSNALG